jgi:hypothetical protein
MKKDTILDFLLLKSYWNEKEYHSECAFDAHLMRNILWSVVDKRCKIRKWKHTNAHIQRIATYIIPGEITVSDS